MGETKRHPEEIVWDVRNRNGYVVANVVARLWFDARAEARRVLGDEVVADVKERP